MLRLFLIAIVSLFTWRAARLNAAQHRPATRHWRMPRQLTSHLFAHFKHRATTMPLRIKSGFASWQPIGI